MDSIQEPGVIADAADQPDLNASQPQPQAEQEQLVPVSALQAERRERQQLQENLKIMQDHLALLQANQQKQQSTQDDLSELADNDVLTVGDFRKIASSFQRQQEMTIAEMKIAQQYPDYTEVVRKYLPDVLKQDPDLKDFITSAPNPYKAAYYIAKRSDSYLQDQRTTQRTPEAKKALENLQKPGNLSAIGQSTAGSAVQSYKTMSDADFMKMANKNLGYV